MIIVMILFECTIVIFVMSLVQINKHIRVFHGSAILFVITLTYYLLYDLKCFSEKRINKI